MTRPSSLVPRGLVLGVTGGLATGKTSVMKILFAHGIPTCSSDDLAHSAIRRGQPAYHAIRRAFGNGILDSRGAINRRKLAKIVFADPKRRHALERIIHPYVIHGLKSFIKRHPTGMIALDIPLLFEARLGKLVDLTVVVSSTRAQEIKRFCRRTGLSRAHALKRIKSQLPLPEKVRRADIVIDNSGSRRNLRREVLRLFGTVGRKKL